MFRKVELVSFELQIIVQFMSVFQCSKSEFHLKFNSSNFSPCMEYYVSITKTDLLMILVEIPVFILETILKLRIQSVFRIPKLRSNLLK
jgi:hypothetical protein